MSAPRDVVIIGGGLNGLVCAWRLAQAGLKPLVLERRAVVGGRAVTEEFHPGFRCSPIQSCGAFTLEDAKTRPLGRHGFEALMFSPIAFAPLPDGRGMILRNHSELATKEIARFSARDAARYSAFCQAILKISAVLRQVFELAPPDIDHPAPGDIFRLLKVGRGVRKMGEKDMFHLLRWGPMAAADLVAEWFEFEPLRAILAARGIHGTALGPWSAGSALMMLMQAADALDPAGPSFVPRGGMGAYSQAVAGAARDAGAEVRTGAEVTNVQVKDGRAVGVVLAGGEEIAAKAVVSGADPKRTFLQLVDAMHLSPDFLARIRNYRCVGTVAKVHLALDGLPTFTAASSLPPDAMDAAVQAWKDSGFEKMMQASLTGQPLNGRIHIGPEIDYLERAFDASKYGEVWQKPYLEATIPTLRDPSLAPSGKHVMSIHVQYAPYKLRDGDWKSRRDELADVAIKTLAAYAPDLPDKILHRYVITPKDLEETYGLSGGHIFHGELAIDQLFTMRPVLGWARYRTPVDGLYLCGAGTHPGIGSNGESGRNAAREILKGLRK